MVLDVVYGENSKEKNNKRIKSGVGTAGRAEFPHSSDYSLYIIIIIRKKKQKQKKNLFFLGRSKLLGTLVNSPPYIFSRVQHQNKEDGVRRRNTTTTSFFSSPFAPGAELR